MARREKIHALILGRRDINEADRLLTLFTRPYGLMKVVAKGVRRIPSRRGGHLEPLTHVLSIVMGSSERRYLAAVEPINTYATLHADVKGLSHAQTLGKMAMRLLPENDPCEEVFDALLHTCEVLPIINSEKQDILEVAVTLFMLRAAGILPEFSACHACGAKHPTDAIILNANQGGWRCLTCHDSFAGTRVSVSPQLLKAMKWLANYPQRALALTMSSDESTQLLAATRHYVADSLSLSVDSYSPSLAASYAG